MDNQKRIEEVGQCLPHNYFLRLSDRNADKGVRTLCSFKLEMEEKNDDVINGKLVGGNSTQ